MEPTRPAAANRVYCRFEVLAGRLISRPLGGPSPANLRDHSLECDTTH